MVTRCNFVKAIKLNKYNFNNSRVIDKLAAFVVLFLRKKKKVYLIRSQSFLFYGKCSVCERWSHTGPSNRVLSTDSETLLRLPCKSPAKCH